MSSLTSGYGHKCFPMGFGVYRLAWKFDTKSSGGRLRIRIIHRDTDERGARKFCKKWNLEFPERQK